jgi:hypothetical protein
MVNLGRGIRLGSGCRGDLVIPPSYYGWPTWHFLWLVPFQSRYGWPRTEPSCVRHRTGIHAGQAAWPHRPLSTAPQALGPLT